MKTSDPPRRPGLTRARITEAALALADTGGVDSLSMRALAKELGVEAMSLYNHIRNKDDLLDLVVDTVVGGIDLPSAGSDWQNELRSRMQMTDVVNRRKIRHAHMVNIEKRIMLEGMRADYLAATAGFDAVIMPTSALMPPNLARLIAEGLTNKEIGVRLFISEHTVDSHVRAIMNKSGFDSRARIAAWMGSSE